MTPTLPMTLVTQISRPIGEGVIFPTGHLVDWPDASPHGTRQRVFVRVMPPNGRAEPETEGIAYRLRDGDWFVPFVRVTEPGTLVRASTFHG